MNKKCMNKAKYLLIEPNEKLFFSLTHKKCLNTLNANQEQKICYFAFPHSWLGLFSFHSNLCTLWDESFRLFTMNTQISPSLG